MKEIKYSFQGLLERVEGDKVTGPMSPVTTAKTIAKVMEIGLNGLVRVDNNQAINHTYDHLIILTRYKDKSVTLSLIVDTGTGILPICSLYPDGELIITPLYKTEVVKKEEHLRNLEAPKRCKENPIIDLDDKGFRELFKQALASNEFDIKEKS